MTATKILVGASPQDTSGTIADFLQNRAFAIVGSQPNLSDHLNGTRGNGTGPMDNGFVNGLAGGMNLGFATSLLQFDRERSLRLTERASELSATSKTMTTDPTTRYSMSRLLPPRTDVAALSSRSGLGGPPRGTYGSDLPDGSAKDAPGPAYAPPSRRFDIWTEVYGSTSNAGDADSSFWIGYLGAHWFVRNDLIVGALVQFDWSDYENDAFNNSSADGFGWLAGPYVAGRVPGTILTYEVRGAWGRSDNSVSPLGTYEDDFDTERWLVTGKLEGAFVTHAVTIKPAVRVSYFEETQESYTDSLSVTIPEQTITLGEVKFGPTFSWTLRLENGSVVAPSLGISGVWNFDVTENATSQPFPLGDDDLRARIDAGISLTTTRGWIFSASGYYDGLGAEDYEAAGGKLRLTVPVQ